MTGEAKEPTGLRVDDFDFELPAELIAQEPPAERGASRLLVMDRNSGELRDSSFSELPSLLSPGDLLVRMMSDGTRYASIKAAEALRSSSILLVAID